MAPHAPEVSVRLKARVAGAVYLLVFVGGGAAVLATRGLFTLTDAAVTANNILLHEQRFWLGFTFNLIVIASYLAVTALFYDLFRPVSRHLSLEAVLFGVAGCAVQAAALVFYAAPWVVLSGPTYLTSFVADQSQALALLGLKLYVQAYNIGLAFFGFYCLLIGCLIFRSGFLPRVLGVLMMFGGLSWLTFLSPPLASSPSLQHCSRGPWRRITDPVAPASRCQRSEVGRASCRISRIVRLSQKTFRQAFSRSTGFDNRHSWPKPVAMIELHTTTTKSGEARGAYVGSTSVPTKSSAPVSSS